MSRRPRPADGGRAPLVAVLMAAALTLMLLDRMGPAGAAGTVRTGVRAILGPAEEAGRSVASGVAGATAGYRDAEAGRQERTRLENEITRLRAEAGATAALAAENARLSVLAGRAATPGAPTVAARVVALAASRPGATFVIDRGTAAGVRPGMPVTTAGALLGRIVESARHRATVLPVTDPNFRVGVRFAAPDGAAGRVGVARGTGPRRPLRVELLDDRSVALAGTAGDVVPSSGLQHGLFPAGLSIGRLTAGIGPGEEPRSVQLQPLADAGRVDLVEVVLWHPPR